MTQVQKLQNPPPIKYSLFEGFKSPLSPTRFSFFEIDGRDFNSVEQFFQFQKAEYFEDNELAERIMTEGVNPLLCRNLGNKIDSSKADAHWPDEAMEIMERGLVAKFYQNKGARKYLFKTGESHLVYCDPEDGLWGIGLSKTHPNAKTSVTWKGENNFGDLLMEVRDTLSDLPEFKKELEEIRREGKEEAGESSNESGPPTKKIRTLP